MKNDSEKNDALRIIDANRNRCVEGLRVVEDFARFKLNDAHLSRLCKEIRHSVDHQLNDIPLQWRNASRDTNLDVGTSIETPQEYHRDDLQGVAFANLQRVKQAMRALEEFAKTLDTWLAKQLEQLRYRVYSLEKAIVLTTDSIEKLANSRLYVLLSGFSKEKEFQVAASTLINAGTHIIQLRDKTLPDRELLRRGHCLKELTKNSSTLFIFNDRPDLALLSDADGVHVGQDELSVTDVRRIMGPEKLIGVSTHSVAEAQKAVMDGANYIGVGPTFPSTTKSFEEFTGPELLKKVAQEVSLPSFAIGGISLENLPEVTSSRFSRVAVGAAVTAAPDTEAAVHEFLSQLESAANC